MSEDFVRIASAKVSLHQFFDEDDVAVLLIAEDGKHLPCRMSREKWEALAAWGTTDVEHAKFLAKDYALAHNDE